MTTRILSLALTLAIGLSGCAELNSIHHEFRAGKGEPGMLTDIHERVILVREDNGRSCAEPSPDAMTAFALTASANGPSTAQITALSASLQQQAAFVGLRTPGIQMLRDAGYRICEAYLNEAIDADTYALLMRRYQRDIVALLAIEQITGTLQTTSVNLKTSASAAASRDDSSTTGAATDSNAPSSDATTSPSGTAAATAKPTASASASTKKPATKTATADSPQPQAKTAGADKPVVSATNAAAAIAVGMVLADDMKPMCFDYLKRLAASASTIAASDGGLRPTDSSLREACVQVLTQSDGDNRVSEALAVMLQLVGGSLPSGTIMPPGVMTVRRAMAK